MKRRNIPFLATLVLAPLMVAGPLPASPASAQEAIMLETIGAVRMAPPEEVRRINDEVARQQARAAQPAAAPQRHAAVID